MPDPQPGALVLSRRSRGAWVLLLLLPHLLLLMGLARAPAAVEAIYGQGIYPLLVSLRLPLDATLLSPAWSIGLALAVWAAVGARRDRPPGSRLRSFGWRVLVTCAVLVHLFPLCWGLNYLRPSAAERLKLKVEVTQAGYADSSRRVVAATNAARLEWGDPDWGDLDAAADRAVQVMLHERGLGEAAFTRRSRALPAGLMLSGGWHGVTIPYTTEAMLDPAMDPRFVPMAMAHEKIHQAGFARESDASFLAFLALIGSPDPRLRYSALFFVVDLFWGFEEALRPTQEVYTDAVVARVQEETVNVPEVATSTQEVYDTYLKANQVEAGIEDYDRVGLLIHAWLQAHPDALNR
jgi:Protein of unknown function (DUF3810)